MPDAEDPVERVQLPSQAGRGQSDKADSGGAVGAPSRSDLSIGAAPAQAPGSGAERSRTERLAIHTLAELLAAVYGGPRKAPNLTAREVAATQTAARLEPEELRRLLGLAESDRTLERTRLLMVFSMERFYGTTLHDPVREFARSVLGAHPGFRTPSLVSALQGHADGLDEEDATRTLAARDFASLRWPDGAPALKRNEAARCRANALACLLLWLRESKGTSLDCVLRCLQSSLWAPAGRRQKTDRQKLKALISARDVGGVAVVYELLDVQLSERSQEATTARRSEERATARAQKAEESSADYRDRFKAAQDEAQLLREQLPGSPNRARYRRHRGH